MSQRQVAQIRERRKIKFVGICTDADNLGCTRWHLFAVLTGRRHSPKLKARYEALKNGDAK